LWHEWRKKKKKKKKARLIGNNFVERIYVEREARKRKGRNDINNSDAGMAYDY